MVKKKMKFELSKHIVSQVNKYSESKNFKDGVNWRDEETFTYTISPVLGLWG